MEGAVPDAPAPHSTRRGGRNPRGKLALGLAAAVLLVAGCSDEGSADAGSLLDESQPATDAKGPLKMSLSRGLDEEIADAPVGAPYALRFTLRNGKGGPVSMDGLELAQVQGDLRFNDALADVRAKGLDREARVFKGWPPDREKVGMEEIGQFSTATVPAGGAIDVLVGYELGSGQLGRFSGVTVVYSSGGVTYRPTFDLAVALCREAFVDGEDCAGESQLTKLIDLDEVGRDTDLPNDVDPAN